MTSPSASEERNALLRARLEELSGAYEWIKKETGRIQEAARQLSGGAESPDGVVVATVGPQGRLLSLTLDPRGSRRLSSDELAAVIVETVNRAGREASSRSADLMAPLLPPGMSVEDMIAGMADPSTFQPDQPLSESTFDEWWSKLRQGEQATAGKKNPAQSVKDDLGRPRW